MKNKDKTVLRLMGAALAILMIAAFFTQQSAVTEKTEYYDIQLEAARKLGDCFAAVKRYKEQLGIPLSEDDFHHTGMIGLPYTAITTTSGALEAKRTAASPDMAALCVRMLYEAGIRPGDTVGAGFSGSFPGMNLAVVAACESMGVKLVCISSVGASTYGANNPELTFPEMLYRLRADGIIETGNAAVTMGGHLDTGADMDPAVVCDIALRLIDNGIVFFEEADFASNIKLRENIYERNGPIDCFIAVGGNITSLGKGESGISLGQGVLHGGSTPVIDESSGLVQRYLSHGLPVINLLNIKKLMADYSMAYDPVKWPPEGASAVYYSTGYSKIWITVGIAAAVLVLLLCLPVRYGTKQNIERTQDHEKY